MLATKSARCQLLVCFLWISTLASAWANTRAKLVQPMQVRAMHVFDNGRGWVTDRAYLLATIDNGAHWQDVTPTQIDNPIQQAFFLNPDRGWVISTDATGTAFALFGTDDGGASWTAYASVKPNVPGAYSVSLNFVDAQHGWLMLRLPSSSNFSLGQLFSSHDGGASWQRLPAPPYAGTFVFTSAKHGILTPSPGHDGIFVTDDAGNSWQRAVQQVLPRANALQTALNLLGTRLTVGESVVQAELNSDVRGWILVAGGACAAFKSQCSQHTRLFATNGAGDLDEITPKNAQPAATPNLVVVSENKKGFDKCAAASASQTNKWWPNTPWSWLNIYIGGENIGCSQSQLGGSWVSSVLATGFTLVPTWVGPQGPGNQCGCSTISTNSTTAYQQGIDEANAATSAANALGLHPPTIIYYDMEHYTPNNQAPVNAFINGWVQGLHDQGNQAGVYGSAYNITYYAAITNVPDATWFASWNGDTSVFGIGGISDSLWSNHERLHQYQGGHDATYNGVTFNIDSNSSDGPVAAGDDCSITEPILSKYDAMGGTGSVLGHCTTDTNPTANGGLYNHFQFGSIYYSQATGTHEVHGAISDKWNALQWELGPLGYPISDETETVDGIGRYNNFEHGAIYWTATTTAHEVHGTIFTLWDALHRQRSCLGYPSSDAYTSNGFERNDFEHGDITWSSAQGALANCPDVIFADGFGN